MSKQMIKRNVVILAIFFVMILLFCVKASSIHIPMVAGLLFIAVLMVHSIRALGGLLKYPYAFR